MAAASDSMHAACKAGNAVAVRRLLAAEPGAAWEQDKQQWLPLHLAARHGHEAVARLLLEAAPQTATAEAIFGTLPLHYAAEYGSGTPADGGGTGSSNGGGFKGHASSALRSSQWP